MGKKAMTSVDVMKRDYDLFNLHYENAEHISIEKSDIPKLRCRCGCRPRYGMSTYSFHRGPDEIHIVTDCGRSIWLNTAT